MKTTRLLVVLSTALAVQGVLYGQALDYSSLVSLWRLNGSAADNFGTNPGLWTGVENYVAGPRISTRAADFNGSSYVNCGQATGFDRDTPFSVTAWIKAGPQDATIIGKMQQGGGYTGWELHAGTGNNTHGTGRLNTWFINNFGANFMQVDSPVIVLDNTWHHVAFTYDGSGAGAGVKIYVDGADATGNITADSLTETMANEVDLNLGSRQNGAGHTFTGAIYEASLWSSMLTADDIQNVFTNGIRPPVLIAGFFAEPLQVYAGGGVALFWEVDPLAALTMDPAVGDLTKLTANGLGSVSIVLENPTAFTLTATKEGRPAETRQVSVGIKPLIGSLSASRAVVPRGSAVALAWEINPNASEATITPQVGNILNLSTNGLGSVVFAPTETAEYVLTVVRNGLSEEARLTITVNDPLPATPPELASLESLWLLNGNTEDAAGANDGHWTGATSYVAGPKPGNLAASFDGSNYLNAGQNFAFDNTSAFSATAWIKGPLAQDSAIIGKMLQGGNFTGWELHVGANVAGVGAGKLNVWLINSYGGNYIQVTADPIVVDDTWHQVAFTYDGSSTAAGVKIYVDGVDANAVTQADSLSGTLLNNTDLNIGSRQNGANHNFRGAIAEAAVWSTALTAENIASLYQDGVPQPSMVFNFAASTLSAFAGESVKLSWEVSPGATVSIEPAIGDVTSLTTNGMGSVMAVVDGPTTYLLRATQAGRSETRQVTVNLKPGITSFVANRVQIPRGGSATLSWQVNPYAAVVLNPQPGAVNNVTTNGTGRLVVSPSETTTYTLVVERGGVFAEAQWTLTVTEPGPVTTPAFSDLAGFWSLDGNTRNQLGGSDAQWVAQEAYVDGPAPGTLGASLSGTNWIDAGQSLQFDANTPFSAVAWIKAPLGQDSTIIGKMRHGGAYTGWELHVGSVGPGRLNVWLINAYGSSFIQVNSDVVVLDDTWHQVAFTYDGSGSAAGVRIYVDGEDATGGASADNLAGPLLNDVPLNFGTRQNGAGHNFRGAIADAGVWNIALTPENMRALYVQGMPRSLTLENLTFAAPSTVSFRWNSEPGKTYRIEASAALPGNWTVVQESYPATGSVTTYTGASAEPRRFFRVRTNP